MWGIFTLPQPILLDCLVATSTYRETTSCISKKGMQNNWSNLVSQYWVMSSPYFVATIESTERVHTLRRAVNPFYLLSIIPNCLM